MWVPVFDLGGSVEGRTSQSKKNHLKPSCYPGTGRRPMLKWAMLKYSQFNNDFVSVNTS